jgi:molecular chaperone HtpG
VQGDAVNGYTSSNPSYKDNLPLDWHSLNSEIFTRVDWTYSEKYIQAKLACNGILIPGGYNFDFKNSFLHTNPILSVFDFDAKLPLNLNRYSLNDQLPFEEELIIDIYKDVIAKLLTEYFEYKNGVISSKGKFSLDHPSKFGSKVYNESTSINDYIFSINGYGLNYSYFIDTFRKHPLILAYVYNAQKISYILKDYSVLFQELDQSMIHYVNREMIDPYYTPLKSGRVIVNKTLFENIISEKSNPVSRVVKVSKDRF